MALRYPVTSGKDFDPCPQGAHGAVCTLIADVGWQPGSQMYPDPKPQVIFRFEVPAERIHDDSGKDIGPAIVYETFTANMGKKANLRAMLEGWRGKQFDDEQAAEFDVSSPLGKPCLINVVHNTSKSTGKRYANISAVTPLPKGMEVPKAENPPIFYGPDDPSGYEHLPDFIKKKIDGQLPPPKSEEPAAQTNTGLDDFEDPDLPF